MSLFPADLLDSKTLQPPLTDEQSLATAGFLGELSDMQVYPHSIVATQQSLFFLGRKRERKLFGVVAASRAELSRFTGRVYPISIAERDRLLMVSPTSAANAAALREYLPFLKPVPLGPLKSIGCGDRLGLATPGHVQAVRQGAMVPVLAQQSVRENARTGRSPQEVMDDAMWGAFQEGWRSGFGADADHLKNLSDIEPFLEAGYTFFTVDPGDFVNPDADTASAGDLSTMLELLEWDDLETRSQDLFDRLADRPIDLGDTTLILSQVELSRAVVKYGRAVAHVVRMYRRLAELAEHPVELEISVDETASPTRVEEHLYIALELKRLGVEWVSLAPRYPGAFEKGIDFKGDLDTFREMFGRHVAVARTVGPYKLSLHSGSDKFSIYPIAASLAGDMIHLKTAGTSYLEALRAVAVLEPAEFRKLLAFSMEHFEADRASYHVSAHLDQVPDPESIPDDGLASLLDEVNTRQVLHVTFGSVLHSQPHRFALYETLVKGEDVHYRLLARHFARHLEPFSGD